MSQYVLFLRRHPDCHDPVISTSSPVDGIVVGGGRRSFPRSSIRSALTRNNLENSTVVAALEWMIVCRSRDSWLGIALRLRRASRYSLGALQICLLSLGHALVYAWRDKVFTWRFSNILSEPQPFTRACLARTGRRRNVSELLLLAAAIASTTIHRHLPAATTTVQTIRTGAALGHLISAY